MENEDSAFVQLRSAPYAQWAPDFQTETAEIKTAFRESRRPAADAGLGRAASESDPISLDTELA